MSTLALGLNLRGIVIYSGWTVNWWVEAGCEIEETFWDTMKETVAIFEQFVFIHLAGFTDVWESERMVRLPFGTIVSLKAASMHLGTKWDIHVEKERRFQFGREEIDFSRVENWDCSKFWSCWAYYIAFFCPCSLQFPHSPILFPKIFIVFIVLIISLHYAIEKLVTFLGETRNQFEVWWYTTCWFCWKRWGIQLVLVYFEFNRPPI